MLRCLSCSKDNPDGQNFCGQCGAALVGTGAGRPAYSPAHLARQGLASRSALEGEKKLVTILFCDIADSTPLAGRIGAEAMHALLNRFFEIALQEVHRYEGTINQFLGDGFMALFGAPVAHEDHARRALLAATSIPALLRATAGESRVAPAELRLRMGVNTGLVVVGRIGDGLRTDYTASGDTTHLAARLQQIAPPGATLVSAATQRAALHYFAFGALGKRSLKGIDAPVEVYEVLGPHTAGDRANLASLAAPTGTALVGRERELAVLSASLEALSAGRGGVVMLQGEPGAGKSRLVAQAIGGSDATRIRRLEGRAVSFGRTLSYWPFIEIVKQCFAIDSADEELAVWRKLEDGTRELFGARYDEIAAYLGVILALTPLAAHEQRVKFLDTQALGRQVFLSMRRLFEELARRRPVLLVLEDWHWVDQSSVALAEHLLPLAANLPLAFWFVHRADPVEPAQRVRSAAARERIAAVAEVSLGALDGAETRALIDGLLGSGGLAADVVGEIARKAEGNPFFTEEVVRALIDDGSLQRDPRHGSWRLMRPVTELAIPGSIQAVIVARIDRLEEGVKSVLKLASVIGRSFFLRILERIAEAGDPVEGSLPELEQAQMIRLRQELPELEYMFKHALVQEAAYESILAERRRSIHRSVAQAIETVLADRLDEFTSLLAYHYALAQDWDKAQHYLFKAGDQSGRMAADAEALEHYRQAEAAYLKSAAGELSALQRASLDRKLGQAYFGIGNYAQAIEHFSRALAQLGVRYPRDGRGVKLAIAKYLALHAAARLSRRLGRPVRATMDRATAREISTICHSLSWLDFFVDEERFALDSLIELHAGDRSGDVLARARGLSTAATVLATMRLYRAAERCQHDAEAIAAEGDDPELATAAFGRIWLLWAAGRLDEAIAACDEAATAYRRIGDIRGWASPAMSRAWLAYQLGDFALAGERDREVISVGESAGDPHVVSWGLMGLASVEYGLGELDAAIARFGRVRDMCLAISSFRLQSKASSMIAKCRVRQGRLDQAEPMIREAIELVERRNLRGMWTIDPLADHAEFLLAKAERVSGLARRAALRAAEAACAKAVRAARDGITWLPQTLRLHGTVAWLQGRAARADERWQESLAAAERYGLDLERARTLLERGTQVVDADQVDAALPVFERLGARGDLALALHARAALRAKEANPDAALADYDAAIGVLAAVGLEYELGIAYRERACWHRRRGDDARAQADLESARRA